MTPILFHRFTVYVERAPEIVRARMSEQVDAKTMRFRGRMTSRGFDVRLNRPGNDHAEGGVARAVRI